MNAFAQDYVFFYGNGCQHCAKVEKFFDEHDVTKHFDIEFKEVYFDKDNIKDFMTYVDKLGLDSSKVGVPFLVINSGADCTYLNGDAPIIDYFTQKMAQSHTGSCAETAGTTGTTDSAVQTDTSLDGTVTSLSQSSGQQSSLSERLSFFGIMLPAAISDSINPCAFAVMLLLLSTILSKHKSRKKALLA